MGEDARTDDGWRGSVALVLASSTGGIGQHVASLARGLRAAGCEVLVCGPAATDELFGFAAAGAAFVAGRDPGQPGRPGRRRGPPAAVRPGQPAGRRGARARPARRLRRRAGPARRSAGRHLAQRGARQGPARAGVGALVERIVARSAALTLGASEDLVARAAALGARNARLGPVAAPVLGRAQAHPRPRCAPSSGCAPDTPLILSVGRLHPQKRYDLLVDAAGPVA